MRAAAEYADEPFAVVIKHTNPCGAALADTIGEAFARAYDCDQLSAFGGIVGLNKPFDMGVAEQCIAGGKFHGGHCRAVLRALRRGGAGREERQKVAQVRPPCVEPPRPFESRFPVEYRSVDGGMLAQTSDRLRADASSLQGGNRASAGRRGYA
jgi:phosphoribosylaminoimidazolecarboxamide formyltransferase / IMP cyclohydrolase